MAEQNKTQNNAQKDFYITIFSQKIFKHLRNHNIFPDAIEPNKRFPQFNVYKYKSGENNDFIYAALKEFKRKDETEGNVQ